MTGALLAVYGVLQFATSLGLVVAAVCGLLLIPRRTRGAAGEWLVTISYLWGATVWLYAAIYIWFSSSTWALVVMLVLSFALGVGAVAVACLAALVRGELGLAGLFVLYAVMVYGVRLLGSWAAIGSDAETSTATPAGR